MPFTISHIAAALPARFVPGLPFAGLAVGAMAPDLEYIVHGQTRRTIGHDPLGIVLLDLPLSLAVLAAAAIAAPGLAPAVPRRWPAIASWLRTWRPTPWTVGGLVRLITAVLIGAVSHVALDEFTHGGSWGPRNIEGLNQVVTIADRTWPLHQWLQYGLSVLGLVVLAGLTIRWFRRIQPPTSASHMQWIAPAQAVLLATMAGVTGAAALVHASEMVGSPGLNRATLIMVFLGAARAGALVLFGAGALGRSLMLANAARSSASTPG